MIYYRACVFSRSQSPLYKEIKKVRHYNTPKDILPDGTLLIKQVEYEKVAIEQQNRPKYHINGRDVYVEDAAITYLKSVGFEAFWAENKFWRLMMILLFWDEFFAKIKSAIPRWEKSFFKLAGSGDFQCKDQYEYRFKTTGFPTDIYKSTFYENRKEIFQNRLSELKNRDLRSEFERSWKSNFKKYGLCTREYEWDRFSLGQFQAVLERVSGERILMALTRLFCNYKQARIGMPDLLAYKGNSFMFIEVKSENDETSKVQRDWHNFLSEIGFDVELLLVNHSNSQLKAELLRYKKHKPIERLLKQPK